MSAHLFIYHTAINIAMIHINWSNYYFYDIPGSSPLQHQHRREYCRAYAVCYGKLFFSGVSSSILSSLSFWHFRCSACDFVAFIYVLPKSMQVGELAKLIWSCVWMCVEIGVEICVPSRVYSHPVFLNRIDCFSEEKGFFFFWSKISLVDHR